MKKYIFYAIFTASIIANIIFFLSDGILYLRVRWNRHIENNYSEKCKDIKDFRDNIYKAGLDIVKNGESVVVPARVGLFTDNLEDNISLKKEDAASKYQWAEMNFLILYSLEYAIKSDDTESQKEIIDVFDKYIIDKDFTRVDQCVAGCVAIELYKLTKNKKYKEYADKEYNWLKQQNTTDFGIKYMDWPGNAVDGLGMHNPFLILYSKTFNNRDAYLLAVEQIEKWNKYGIDKDTGLPAYFYRYKYPNVKMGNINWGRGNSWYVLGLCDIDINDYSAQTAENVRKFIQTTKELYNQNKCFHQYIGQVDKIDLSATLPIIYYLQKIGEIKLSDNDLLEYSIYMHNGLLYNSSGSQSQMNSGCPFSGPNRISQAFMLKLLIDR